MARDRLLTACAWAVHLYTALGAVAGLFALNYIADREWHAAFVAMALATAIDASDGTLARALHVHDRIPVFDGALLDNVIDYLTFVAAPALLMLRARMLPPGATCLAVAGAVMVASGYGFCRVDAKTTDHYFRGFPSYWNIAALYLYCLGWSPALNAVIIVLLAAMVFVPIKYIYPSRTEPLRPLTLALAAVWAVATAAVILTLPAYNRIALYISLTFVVYYLVMSVALHAYPARRAARQTP
jgi:phosphatidylcholine synthase